jgi:hypothetical protein
VLLFISVTCPPHFILLDLIILIILEFPHYAVFSNPPSLLLLGSNILLSTLFSNILSLYSYLNIRDQVSHLYRTTGRIIFLYILIVTLLDGRLEDEKFWTEC